MHKSVKSGLVHFLLLDNLLHSIIAHNIHIDLNLIGVYENFIYVLVDHHAAVCQSTIL